MADVINLATFQFDTDKLAKSLSTLQDTMFKLKKEQESYTSQSRDAQKEIDRLAANTKLLTNMNQVGSDAWKENEKAIAAQVEIQKKAYKSQQDTATQIARVRQEVTATNTQLKAYMNTEAQQQSLIDSGNVALSKQITNINQARASNTELLRVRNQLNPTIEEEAKMIAALNQRLDQNNNFIKENASQYEQQKINIGNYTQSIKDALSSVTLFGVNISSLRATMEPLNGIVDTAKNQMAGYASQMRTSKENTEGMGAAQKAYTIATNVATGATKILALALAATGIGLIIAAVALLIGYLKTFDPIVDRVQQAFAGFGAVVEVVQKVIVDFVGGLSDIGATVDKVGKFLKNPIAGFKELGKEMKQAAQDAVALTKATQDLEDVQILQEVQNARASQQIKELMLQSKNRALTEEERLKKLKEANEIENQNYNERASLANKELDLAERAITTKAGITERDIQRLRTEGAAYAIALKDRLNVTDEEVKAVQQAEINKYRILEESTTIREKIQNQSAALEEKAAAEAKKRNDDAIAANAKRVDASIKSMQVELDFYLESQGDRKKDMADQLALDKEIMRQQLAINKAEYDAKRLNRREYELANLEAQNEFGAKQTAATIANAEMEFELFKLNNQRKLEENTFFSQELYNQELDRINRLAEAEAAQATLQYEQGIINAQEYALAIRQVDENQRVANEAVDAERAQAKKDQQAADIAIQDELNAGRFEYDLALSNERFQREYEERKKAAIKNNADMTEFEKSENQKRVAMESAVQANKRQLASQTFGDIAKLLGESTAAGKAAAIAQATIDTYSGVAAVWSTPAVIPEPFATALKIASTTTVLASGLANVKKITAVKAGGGNSAPPQERPSYARGIIGAGTGTSDSVTANLSAGESVLTARATQMFAPQLAAMNQAGGGVGLNGMLQGSSSAMVQDSIRSAADSSINMDAIVEAVMTGSRLGTSIGSQEGITNLSTNRKIMQDAQF